MRKLIMWNIVTLDGKFEGEKPWDLSFHELVWGPELEALSITQLEEASMLIFGENTYKGMSEYWQNAEATDPKVFPLMNNIAKVVCSSIREKADWNNTTIIRDAVSEIKTLKEKDGGPIFIFGSSILSQSLIDAELFDEIRLCIAPTILGKGRNLFAKTNTQHNLKLLDTQQLNNGGIILRYEVLNNNANS